jgi:hypothetical protein
VFDTVARDWVAAASTVDQTGLEGFGGHAAQGGVAIAFDTDGAARVAYAVADHHTQIRVRSLVSGTWSPGSEPLRVDGSFVWHPALAYAATTGTWFLAAYDSTQRVILATRDTGAGWGASETVATDVLGPENIDQGPALLVTPTGSATVLYLDSSSHLALRQSDGGQWIDVPLGGDYFTHAPGVGLFADGTLIIAGHDHASPPNAINALQGGAGDWGNWEPAVTIRADGSEVFRWAGAYSTPGATFVDLLFFDEDTDDDGGLDDQTLYYAAIPLRE